ncbi:MAG: DUF1844 domain-containing protein [Armatimonadota bacterium]
MTEEKKDHTREINPEDLFPQDIYTFMKVLISSLSSQAWIFLGLVPHPVSKKTEKDIAQVKIAIDTIEFIHKQIEDKLDEQEKNAFAELIGNLKLNFIEQNK